MPAAPPGGALVPLLLLLLARPPPPAAGCSFDFDPVSSTFGARLDELAPWLLLDYPVAMPANLAPDAACSDLWALHFGAAALGRMAGAAGGALAPRLRAAAAQVAFVAECRIQDPQGCVRLETVNASRLLAALRGHLAALRGRPPRFPACARLRCRPGDPTTPPDPEGPPQPPPSRDPPRAPAGGATSTLLVGQEGAPASGPAPGPRGHGLLLLGGVGGGLGLAAAAWVLRRRPCAQRAQASEPEGR